MSTENANAAPSVAVGGVIVDIAETAPTSPTRASTVEEQVNRASKIYSGDAVQQVVNIFKKYDVNESGVIETSELPRMCHDLNIKPWVALKELGMNSNGQVEIREFISWWFSSKTEHSRQEETYVHNIFDRYDDNKDGKLDQSELVRMCNDLGVKPWKVFKEIDFEDDGNIGKRQFTRWWFTSNAKKEETAAQSSPSKARRAPGSPPSSPRQRPSIVTKKLVMSSPTKKAERVAACMADVKRAMAALEEALQME